MLEKRKIVIATGLVVALCSSVLLAAAAANVDADLSPSKWQAGYDEYMAVQLSERDRAGVATGNNGAVTVAYNGLAARAGLEALQQGGNAIDALLATAFAQNVLTAGAPISFFGIMSLVYYDAETGEVHTMNAEWNTLLEEDSPMTIPGGIDMSDPEKGILGRDPSGRTALVGGFMRGAESAHQRFGKLPWARLFEPSIHMAEQGFELTKKTSAMWTMRGEDLERLEETRKTLLKPDGSIYVEGDVFKQPALAATLRAVAKEGADHMYRGPWAKRLVEAVRADGGKMTLEDLSRYEPIWSEPLVADFEGGWTIATNPPPNFGGTSLIQAQRLARASGMLDGEGHFSESADGLRKALDITQLYAVEFIPAAMAQQVFGGVDFSPAARITKENADQLWGEMARGKHLTRWKEPPPRHSDDVVVIDGDGNIAAITQSINCVIWGKTAIVVDGITIGDPGSFQQAQIARAGPGNRLESPTETGIVFKDGEPVLGFASMGSGLHQRTFQGLLNFMHYGMTVDEAIDQPDFFMPRIDPSTLQTEVVVPKGRFDREVLDGLGYAYEEVEPGTARFAGEGIWIAISRDPKTGELRAASHNRNNSAAVAY